MATITWVGGFSNNFTDKQNWSPQQVPGASDDAIIEPATATTILVAGANTLDSLTTNANVTLEVTSGSLSLTDSAGTATSINAGTILVEDNTELLLAGTIDNSGTIATNGTYNGSTLVLESSTVTLTGGGALSLLDNAPGREVITGGATTDALVNVSETIAGAGQILGITLVNQATIDADATHSLIIGATATNTGLLEATASGGLVLESVIDNASGTILASGSTDNVVLSGAAIQSGTLETASGGAIVTAAGSTNRLDGASFGTLKNTGLFEVVDNSTVDLLGTIRNSGTIATEGTYNGATLALASTTVKLAGGGVLSLLDNSPSREVITGSTSTDVLVNVNDTITGAGSIEGLVLTNQGTVDASGANALIIAASGSNSKLLEATDTGGLVLTGVIDNAGGTILASGAGDNVDLENGSVEGGMLQSSGSGEIVAVGGFYSSQLDGATAGEIINAGTVLVQDNARLLLSGTIDNSGIIATNGTYNGSTLLLAGTTVSLTGSGQISLLDNSPGREAITGSTGTETLVNASETIAGAGLLSGMTLLNQATLDADATHSLTIEATTTNSALLEATSSGGLLLESLIDNEAGAILSSGTGDNVLLAGATIQGGILESSNGGAIVTVGGTSAALDGATFGAVTNTALLELIDNSSVYLIGTIANSGTIATDGTYNGATLVLASQTVTLTGGGQISLLDNAPSREVITGGTTTPLLVNMNDTISGAGSIEDLVLSNSGTIDAGGANALMISASGSNTDLMEATNTGGLVLTGVIDNAGGTILASGAGDNVDLENGTIAGGTLQSSSGGEIVAVGGFYSSQLDGATAGAIINLGTVLLQDNARLLLAGTIDNSSTIATTGTYNGSTLVLLSTTVALTGGGVVSLLDNLPSREVITGSSSADVLLNVDNMITGAGSIEGLVLTNESTIDASGANALIVAAGGSNTGLMEATNTGGLVLTGVIDNAGGTILASGAGHDVDLENGTIEGGTLQSSGGGEIVAVGGFSTSELDGLTAGAITNDGTALVQDNARLLLAGTIDNSGIIATNGTYNGSTLVLATATVALTGGGVVSLLDNSPGREVITGSTGTETLVNASDTIEGAGSIETLAFFSNQGAVNGSGANALIIGLGAGTVTNTGLFESSDTGGLTITGGVLTNFNAGTLTGGAWEAAVGAGVGTLALDPANTGAATTDAADIIFSGTAGVIEAFNGTTYVALQNSLASIASGGTLAIENGYNYATAIAIQDAGFIDLLAGTFSAGGTASITAGGQLTGFGTVASAITSAGSIIASGGNLSLTGTSFSNTGLIDAASGNIIFAPSVTDTNLSSGTLTGGTWEAVAGTLDITGGSITTDAATIILSASGSELSAGNGSTFTPIEQTLKTIAPRGALDILGNRNYSTGRPVTDQGLIQLGGGIFHDLGTLTIAAGGTFSGDGTLFAAAINNSGSLVAAAGGTLILRRLITGSGALLATGTLDLTGTGNLLTGTLLGSGLLEIGKGSTTIEPSSGSNISHLELLAGATLALGANVSLPASTFTDLASAGTSTLNLAGNTLTLSHSTFTGRSGGTALIDGGGTLANTGTMTLNGAALDGSTTLSNSKRVDQTGSLALGDTSGGTAAIANQRGATYDITAAASLSAASATADTITNAGLFEMTGSGTAVIAAAFTNTGTIEVTSGTLELTAAFTNTGSIIGSEIQTNGTTFITAPAAALFNQYAAAMAPPGGSAALVLPPHVSLAPTLAAPHAG